MSKVYGSDNSGYKNFEPTYEYPILRRQILSVSEDTNRIVNETANTQLSTPLRFTFQNTNPMTMIRSARYRLPIKVVFKDQEGLGISPEQALEMGVRNRQAKCFRQQKVYLNGMTFYHDSRTDRVEEFTHRYWDKGQQFQLENTGLPIARPRTYQYKTDTSLPTANASYDVASASNPID